MLLIMLPTVFSVASSAACAHVIGTVLPPAPRAPFSARSGTATTRARRARGAPRRGFAEAAARMGADPAPVLTRAERRRRCL